MNLLVGRAVHAPPPLALMSWQIPPPPPLLGRGSNLPIIEDALELVWGHSLAGDALHIKSPALAKLAAGITANGSIAGSLVLTKRLPRDLPPTLLFL